MRDILLVLCANLVNLPIKCIPIYSRSWHRVFCYPDQAGFLDCCTTRCGRDVLFSMSISNNYFNLALSKSTTPICGRFRPVAELQDLFQMILPGHNYVKEHSEDIKYFFKLNAPFCLIHLLKLTTQPCSPGCKISSENSFKVQVLHLGLVDLQLTPLDLSLMLLWRA